MRTRNERAAGRRVAAKLAAIKRAAGDEAEDVIDDVSDALDVEKDDVVEVVVDDPDGLVAELEVAGETELAGEVQEISLKVRQDYDEDEDEGGDVDDDPREARRRAARMAARRRMAQASRGRGSRRSSAGSDRRAPKAAGSRRTLASMLRKAYSWDLLEDFAKAMGVDGDPDGKAQNTLDALANGQENVQDYVAFLREGGDEFKSKVADELLSEFGKADLAPEPGEQQAEPVIDVDDPGIEPAHGPADDAMPYDVDDPVEARRAAARKAAMRAAKARRSAKPSAKAKAPKGGVRVSRRSAVAGVAGQKPQEDNTTVDKSAFLFV